MVSVQHSSTHDGPLSRTLRIFLHPLILPVLFALLVRSADGLLHGHRTAHSNDWPFTRSADGPLHGHRTAHSNYWPFTPSADGLLHGHRTAHSNYWPFTNAKHAQKDKHLKSSLSKQSKSIGKQPDKGTFFTTPPEHQFKIWPNPSVMPAKAKRRILQERYVDSPHAPWSSKALTLNCGPIHEHEDEIPSDFDGKDKENVQEDTDKSPEERMADNDLFQNAEYRGYFAMEVSTPMLAPFLAEKPTQTAVLIMPGGGGLHISWEVEGTTIAKMFQNAGISAFVLKYRVPASRWEQYAHVMDAQRAMSYVRAQKRFKFVGMLGASYGGKTAMMLSTMPKRLYRVVDTIDDEDFRPDFAILLYPNYIFFPYWKYVDLAPPTFIVAANDDKCSGPWPAEAYYQFLKSWSYVDSALFLSETGGHGFGNCDFYEDMVDDQHGPCQWFKGCLRWLNAARIIQSIPDDEDNDEAFDKRDYNKSDFAGWNNH